MEGFEIKAYASKANYKAQNNTDLILMLLSGHIIALA